MLTDEISDMCARVLEHPNDEELLFVGRLWSARKQQLLPAFGRFAPETWGTRFKHGAGIAGHAFRFGVGTCWMQVAGDADPAAERIYRQREGGAEPDRHWIVEIPLFYCEGLPIGTIGFAAPKGQAANGSALGSLVAQIVLENDEKARARLDLSSPCRTARAAAVDRRAQHRHHSRQFCPCQRARGARQVDPARPPRRGAPTPGDRSGLVSRRSRA